MELYLASRKMALLGILVTLTELALAAPRPGFPLPPGRGGGSSQPYPTPSPSVPSAPSSSDSDERDFDNVDPRRPRRPNNDRSAQSQQIGMQQPYFEGNGCAPGTSSATLSPDQKTLSLIFDNYIAEAGLGTGSGHNEFPRRSNDRVNQKACAIIIPFRVPSNMHVTVMQIDYRGYNYIPQGGLTNYLAKYYFMDPLNRQPMHKIISRKKTFVGPLDQDYLLSSSLEQNLTFSPCGKNFNLVIDSRIVAQSNAALETTRASIDSVDTSSQDNLSYHLFWEQCRDSGSGSDRQPIPGPVPKPPRPGRGW